MDKDNMSQETKVIAFYLPQFHATPENDEWWGEGFTEWTNVRNAKPLFEGHDQPKIPLNNNYYNLLDDEVKKWQVQIARENGVYGFCFYHYWFGGKLMLQKPLEQYLANKELDLPYCFCWANPPWTKVWAGQGSTILISELKSCESLFYRSRLKEFQHLSQTGNLCRDIYYKQWTAIFLDIPLIFKKR